MRCAPFNARTRRFFVNDREHPYTTPAGRPFNWFRGRQVGGRLHVWGRVALRLSEPELAGWPLAGDDLAPFYDEVEELMGVRSVALTAAEERLGSAVPGLVPTRVAERDAAPVPGPIRAAQATGQLTLRSDAVVRRVRVDSERGRDRGGSFGDGRTGEAQEVRARCRGVVAPARSRRAGSCSASGIGDSSGRLGRFLMDHAMTGIGGPLGEVRQISRPRGSQTRGVVTGHRATATASRAVWAWRRSVCGTCWAHWRMLRGRENRVTLYRRAT